MPMLFLAITGGFLPAVVWLWFWLKEDERRPEPTSYIIQAFLIGGLAVIVAFFLERPLLLIFGELKSTYVSWSGFELVALPIIIAQSGLILSWASIEEIVKFLGAKISVFEHREFDEPIDAMIYMITVALGFAAVENSLFLFDTLSTDGNHLYFLLTGHLRFLGATVVHVISSAVVGGAVALTFYRHPAVRAMAIFIGLVVAIVLHAFFNFFIINNDGQDVLAVLVALWVAAISIILLFEKVKRVSKPFNFIKQ
mgnify:CR=1 FL=1